MYSRKVKLTVVFFICSLLLFSYKTEAQQPQVEEVVIAGISVSGNIYADIETIISISGLRVGNKIKLINDFNVQNAVQNLWKREQFSYIDIKIDKISQMGAFLEIIVREYPRLNNIEIKNNKELDEFEIKKAIDKSKGDIISNHIIQEIKDDIIKLYNKEGMSFVEVEIEKKNSDTSNFIDLTIFIEEGSTFKVKSITFEGNKELESDDLEDSFDETSTKVWWQFWKSAKFDKELYEKDKQLLVKYMQNQGFIDAQLISDTIIYNQKEKTVDLVLTVEEGPKVYIRNIKFEGNMIYKDDVLAKRIELKKGDIYNVEKFQRNMTGNENLTDIASLYMDNGYLQANLVPEIYRVPPDSVDIVVKIYENDRMRFGKVEIVGNTKTKDKVIRRELYTRPGDYFDRSAIIRSIRALQVLQYFNAEKLLPDYKKSETDNTAVDLVYKVEEKSTDTFNASLGYAGSFGLTGSIGFTFNNFSITEPLKGGAGQIFNFQWEFGQGDRYRVFSLGLTEPWLFDEPTTLGFNIFDSFYNFQDIHQARTGLALNIGRRFRWPDDYWRGDWSFRAQLNDIKNNFGYNQTYYREGKYTEIAFGQRVSRISINNMFFPSVGSKFTFSTDFAAGALGIGQVDFMKNELNYETFAPLAKIGGSDRLVLMLGAKMGYIDGLKSDTTISPIELYRLGGNGLSGMGANNTPLRGYEDNSIGATFTGQKFLLKYTTEVRFAIALEPMPVYVYGFAEAGNIFSSFKKADPFDLKRSAGFGVQLMIAQLGVIGFSYGYGFDLLDDPRKPNTISGWKFLFHLGQ